MGASHQARYAQTAKGRAAKERYRTSQKGRATEGAAKSRWKKTEKGRASIHRYKTSDKGRAAQALNNWRRRGIVGATWEKFEELNTEQGGLCKLCGEPPSAASRLDFEHCHATGRIRGLTCRGCNARIQAVEQGRTVAPEIAARIAVYLQGGES